MGIIQVGLRAAFDAGYLRILSAHMLLYYMLPLYSSRTHIIAQPR